MLRGAAALFVVLCFAWPPQQAAAGTPSGILVRARAGASASELRSSLAARGLSLGARIPHTQLFTVRANGRDRASALRALRVVPHVAAAMPDGVVHAFETPNDPLLSTAESYLSTIRLPQAWDLSHGATGTVIAVVDTGVSQVPDLSSQILPGWNFVAGNDDAGDDSLLQHGTLVAGAAAATTNNGIGIAGAAWNASVLPVKVIDSRGYGTDSRVAEGVVWAAEQGARVINLSLGGPLSSGLCDAVTYAQSKGALVVAAAGNGSDDKLNYPAACPGVLAVSATDAAGNFASFSSFGPDVGIAAPGLAVTSTGSDGSYRTVSGTSLAAPIVTGVAALVIAQHPDWSATQVEERLEDTAQDRGPPATDQYYGHGLLDAYAALGGEAQAPAILPRDTLEPNDDATNATPLERIAKATIAPEGDVDWYAIVLRRPARVSLDIVAVPYETYSGPNLLPTTQLYDADLNRLATSVSSNARITARLPAGRYFVRVANSCGARSAGSYSISVSVHSSPRGTGRLVL